MRFYSTFNLSKITSAVCKWPMLTANISGVMPSWMEFAVVHSVLYWSASSSE